MLCINSIRILNGTVYNLAKTDRCLLGGGNLWPEGGTLASEIAIGKNSAIQRQSLYQLL